MKTVAQIFWSGMLVVAACLLAFLFARPASVFSVYAETSVAKEEETPDCERTRFSLEELLGSRWLALTQSCLQGSCETLREALFSAGFPLDRWVLRLPDDETLCIISRQGLSPECAVLRTRLDAKPPVVWLQLEGKCQESE